MFTGIIETLGNIKDIQQEGSNVHFNLSSDISSELTVDQSLAHNGVCLTVTSISGENYTVTAVDETLNRTNLGELKIGDFVNLERAMHYNGRLDGHIVQGHVDAKGICTSLHEKDGSWEFHFEYTENPEHLLVDKGSVCINGVSLTVISPTINSFSVAIIPYTFEHTTFKNLKVGQTVNLEFDILGKYIARYAALYAGKL
jgi:riboflavin synthase